MRTRKWESGFTLIEMMVVVTILGLMLTLVFTGSKSLLPQTDRKSTRLNSSHYQPSRMPSSA